MKIPCMEGVKNWIKSVHYKANLSIKVTAYLNVVVRTHVRTAGGTVVPRAEGHSSGIHQQVSTSSQLKLAARKVFRARFSDEIRRSIY